MTKMVNLKCRNSQYRLHPCISIRGYAQKYLFLDASSHLYKRVCPSVGPSVGPSVCHAFVKNAWNWEFYVQKWSWRHTKSWITSKQLSSTSTTKGGYCRTQISSSHLSHLYKRICPKMLEDASLAAGPCSFIVHNGYNNISLLTTNFPRFLERR